MAQVSERAPDSPAQTHSLMILSTSEKMRDAYAANNREEFYRYFTISIGMLSPAMPFQIRQRVEDDQKVLLETIKKIYDNPSLPVDGKKESVIACKFAFAERHLFIVFSTMARTDIFRPRQEGMIDFSKYDIAILAEAVKAKERNDAKEAIDKLAAGKMDDGLVE